MQLKTFSIGNILILLILVIIGCDGKATKKKLIPEIDLCKQYDPNLQECYCANFRKMTPILKNGYPRMKVQPIDPAIIETIKMDFTQTKSFNFIAHLHDVKVYGISKTIPNICQVFLTKDGVQFYFDLHIPKITLKSKLKAKGTFLLLGIDAVGEFNGEFDGMNIRTKWNSTRYSKRGEDYLKFTTEIEDMQIDKLKVHFSNLFGDNTELNDNINLTINENIDSLYGEIKPIILETISSISLRIVNDFYAAVPFDELYPLK